MPRDCISFAIPRKLHAFVTQTADDDAVSFGRCERILGPS
jgi:hypothetical protein